MKTITVFALDEKDIIDMRRQTFSKSWLGEGKWIRFTTPLISMHGGTPQEYTYCYPHDVYLAWVMSNTGAVKGSESWDLHGRYSMPTPSIIQMELLSMFRVS